MDYTNYAVEITLTENMLGTVPKNQAVYKNYIASKAAELTSALVQTGMPTEEIAKLQDEEVETVQTIEEKGWTGFHQDEDGPFLYDYAIKGFFCDTARTMKQFGSLKQLQDKFKRYTFIKPRKIRLPKPENGSFPVLERPLRAMTAMGPRVTVTRSDYIPAGTKLVFTLKVYDAAGITEKLIKDVLAYGEDMGLNQWRSGGYGRFTVDVLEEI